MAVPLITSSLTQAGLRLLETLSALCREYAEATDSAVYHRLERDLQAAANPDRLQAAFDAAQAAFGGAALNREWLDVFAHLLDTAADPQHTFAQNLWRAFLFGSQNAARSLWDQYEEVHSANGTQPLPGCWGDWLLPMQSFAAVTQDCLLNQNPVFGDLLTSDDLFQLIEEHAAAGAEPDLPHAHYAVIGKAPFDESTLHTYLSLVTQTIGHAGPRYTQRGAQVAIPLDDVFVPVRLVPLAEYNRPADTIRHQTATYNDPELNAFHAPLSHHQLEASAGVDISTMLAGQNQILVLGGIGAGKTTLLHYTALQYATILGEEPGSEPAFEKLDDGSIRYRLPWPLPIFVDLAAYIEARLAGESLQAFMIRTATEQARDDGIERMLLSLLESGQCVILLDGMDQTATDAQRQVVVAEVSACASLWADAGNQVVVTGRFEGYDINPLPPDFACYLLRPFTRDQISSFMLNWRRTLVRMQRPLSSDEDVLRQASGEMWELLRRINSSPRLFALLNTPLLLRMLVETYRPGMMLLPQKAALYKLISDALIHEWRLPQVATHRPTVLEGEVVTLLGELAYWLHGTRPTGMITEHELEQILANIWGDMHPDASADDVVEAIGDFIGTLRLHPGVLMELAPQRYGFVYQGLQEYFAARRLVSSFRRASERIRYHLHDARWNEVIALAVGFVALSSPDDASDLMEAAVLARGDRAVQFGQASSPFESLLKRDLLFAVRLLADGIEARPEVTRAVVNQLMEMWLYGERDSLGRFSLIFDSARRHLMKLDGTIAGRIAFQMAIDQLEASDEYLQAYAIDALTFWPSLYDEALAALSGLMVENRPPLVRRALARALSYIGPLTDDGYRVLIALTGDADERVRETARKTLDESPPVPLDTLGLWLEFLHSDDERRRRVGLRRFREIGPLPPGIVAELLHLLDDPDQTIRRLAVETLAGASNLTDDARVTIYRSLVHADPAFRHRAIEALAGPVMLPATVLDLLIRWTDDPDGNVRRAALGALGACLNDDPAILDAVRARFDDAADSVREAAIEPLVLKGKDHPSALHILGHVAGDPIAEVRAALARAVRHITRPDVEIQWILSTLLSDREIEVREAALDTIGELDYPGTDVLDHLVGLVTMPDHPIKGKAVVTLAKQRNLPEWALLALVQALGSYGEVLGEEIVACLRDHAPLGLEVLAELTDLATPREHGTRRMRAASSELRSLALEILGYSLDESPVTQRILAEALESDNRRVRVAAMRGLAHVRQVSPDVLERLERLLRSDQLEVRCAAGVTLGHLIRGLPYLALEGDDLLGVARGLARTLSELTPHAAWERESQSQNEILQALNWVVARCRPDLPRLSARSEDAPGYSYE